MRIKQDKTLLNVVKKMDREFDSFVQYMSKKYKIPIWRSGCLEMNSWSFLLGEDTAKAIHPRRIEKWREQSGW